MWSLWQIGRLTEASGCSPSADEHRSVPRPLPTSLWSSPIRISAGASGALFGIVGALISALYLGKLPFPKPAVQRILKNLVIVVVVNLLFGASVGFIDNSAHIGGLIAGLGIGAVLAPHLNQPREQRLARERLIFTAVGLCLIGAGVYVKQHSGWAVEKFRQLQQSAQPDDSTT
jgi:hypothetical protein